ncbi:hypothetical protein ACFWPX_30085 [Nocardia sp. NPDC058518]|uniref:hypothetical protein n=1 Tax=Nocardia sp. NPDC058518 TaxID=3346534 RepID=UPI003662945B
MPTSAFYSDRESGPTPRDKDVLADHTREGLLGYVITLVNNHWFAEQFPLYCDDGNGIYATATNSFLTNLHAHIHDIKIPLATRDRISDTQLFDLLDYTATKISKPERTHYHGYAKHHELKFDRRAGFREARDSINTILARGCANYEMDTTGRIQRLGPEPLRDLLAALRPNTGDPDLDETIARATQLYTSRDPNQRQDGLEKLWDGFQRLKTIKGTGSKPAMVAALLAAIEPDELREVINDEMHALNGMGNKFRIRHHEIDTIPVPGSARDYFFIRMGSMLLFLLQENKLLNTEND